MLRDRLIDYFELEDGDPELKGDLNSALYSLSEMVFPYNIDRKMAIDCWRIVEKMRGENLPEEFEL